MNESKVYQFANKNEDITEIKDGLRFSLEQLMLENGASYASSGKFYIFKCWIRDCFYTALPFVKEDPDTYKRIFQTLLDYFLKMENDYGKFSWLIVDPILKPNEEHRFIHPRFDKNLCEIPEKWGYIQTDTLGEFLFGICLGEENGIRIIRDDNDLKIIALVIKTLEEMKYWELRDNGLWEERRAINSSSVGACISGLTKAKSMGFKVNQEKLDKARESLYKSLPKEADDRYADLALLSLIYPFNIVDKDMAKRILDNVTNQLEGKHGVKRYLGDRYYNRQGKESFWTFGFSFKALAYQTIGDYENAEKYARKVIEDTVIKDVELPMINKSTGDYARNENGDIQTYVAKYVIPEMFLGFGNQDVPNDNLVLCWSNALAIKAINTILLKNENLF